MNKIECSKCSSEYWKIFLNLDGSCNLECKCGVKIEKLMWGEKKEYGINMYNRDSIGRKLRRRKQ